jgi:hypothetical protein
MRLIAPWRSVACPFCFRRFHLSEAPSRAMTGGERERDIVLGKFLGVPAPDLPRVVEPPPLTGWKRLMRRCFLRNDPSSMSKRVCPHCHLNLPHAIASGQLSGEVIAIIGARSSGKSNYFGVLLNTLEKRFAGEIGFRMFDQETFSLREMRDISSRQLYRERYGNRLYGGTERYAIDQTSSAATNKEIRIPLIYRLEFPKPAWQYLLHPLTPVNALDLIIFDAAGEDMADETVLEQFYRYILRASGIIFLIDPFQYPGIRKQLPPELQRRLPPVEHDPVEIVARVINLYERRLGVAAGQKIRTPAAFVLSKSDLLKDLVHRGSLLCRDSCHDGGFNAADCALLSGEVRECIRSWDGPQLVDLAERSFSSAAFFAVSALGEMPDESMRLHTVCPLRVADPLLWLLWKRGYVRTAQPKP